MLMAGRGTYNSTPLKINSYETYKRNHSPPRAVIIIIITVILK
jgi:hypothetical protein